MASATHQNRVRVGGSGFTIFTFGGQPITFCQQVAHTSPQPVGQGASAIQPMDEPYPVEIITPAAAGMGSLTLNMFELFGSGGNASKAWDRLGAGVATSTGLPFGALNQGGQGNVSTLLNLSQGHPPFDGLVDIVDIFITQARLDPTKMQIVKYIRPLVTSGSASNAVYTEEYHGCVITNVTDGENIDVGTLDVIKTITVAYRYLTRNGRASQAFKLRDAQL